MRLAFPRTLSRLQSASEGAERETAWADFVATYSDVVLHTCRSVVREHDAAMDAYAFVLEALQQDGHRRLRAYAPDGRTEFSTWLIVVTRRLVLDHVRQRYGRPRSEGESHRAEAATRRRLEDLVGEEIDPDELAGASNSPDAELRRAELTSALRQVLDELEPRDRLLLSLRFEDERSIREIARIVGLPTVFHVYRRLGAVLGEVRRRLVQRGVEGPDA